MHSKHIFWDWTNENLLYTNNDKSTQHSVYDLDKELVDAAVLINWRNRQSNSDSCKCSCDQDKYAVGGIVMLKAVYTKSQKPLKEELILSLTLNIKGFWVAL